MKTQGRRGEVAAESHSDVPERFVVGLRVLALLKNGTRRELQIDEFWPHKGLLVLKFDGVDSMDDAETLLGSELQVPLEQRAELESGWTYISDLVGCALFDGDREVGIVRDVQFGAGEAPLLIVESGGRRLEIPYAEAYLTGVDPGHKKIRMQLPDGLLELDAPLTAEEKEQQRKK